MKGLDINKKSSQHLIYNGESQPRTWRIYRFHLQGQEAAQLCVPFIYDFSTLKMDVILRNIGLTLRGLYGIINFVITAMRTSETREFEKYTNLTKRQINWQRRARIIMDTLYSSKWLNTELQQIGKYVQVPQGVLLFAKSPRSLSKFRAKILPPSSRFKIYLSVHTKASYIRHI
jgi:hypothetical protein